MAYNTLDDILGEIAAETLVQLVNDSDTSITVAMIQTALTGDLEDIANANILDEVTGKRYRLVIVDGVLDKQELADTDADMDVSADDQIAAAVAAAAAVSKCLNRASALVDGYCSNLYDVPFDTPSPFLKSLDLDVVIYNLFSRRENVPENRKDRYNNTVKILAKIGSGDIQLGVTGPTAPDQKGQTIAISSAPENIFTMDRLKNY